MAQQGGAQVVGNIGMYYAAYRLSQQGWNVMPTARNARALAPAQTPVLGNLSRVILRTHDRGGVIATGQITDRISSRRFVTNVESTGLGSDGNNRFSRNADPTPRRDKTVS
jgi:hypothetical protein